MPNKKDLSERDICTKYITPALIKSGWDLMRQFNEEVRVRLTNGKVIVKGKLHTQRKGAIADYVLYYKPNIPVAIIEVKKNTHSIRAGMQQALRYHDYLQDVPCVYSSNGDGFIEHDFTQSNGKIEREISLDEFPSPEELWKRYKKRQGIEDESIEQVIQQPYFIDSKGKKPRYYQQIAVNRIVEAIAKGQKRILLVMATGTGKTLVAFHTIYRLWKSKAKKRILFLADRNALITQTKTKDFKHFGDAMTVIRKKKIDKSYEIYLALYQGLTNYDEDKDAYREFSRDFFDLIVIDECHRGSAKTDSAWREILDYFGNATHIGLTATPKETKDVSNIDYFGDPIYTYSLRQGIEDGFLAPYQVLRIGINVDLEGWRPEEGKTDKQGVLIEDREYNRTDYDRTLVIDERTWIVAKKITEFLKNTNRMSKTIVFCVDIEHAQRMREALINLNADIYSKNRKYIMQITGDNQEGKDELAFFQKEEYPYPTIVTTSKLLTTGVDVPTCKVIVLDAVINSPTEFKQIIGRGTRLSKEYGKYYFTILDFRENARQFAADDFDGPPIQDERFEPGEEIDPEDPDNSDEMDDDEKEDIIDDDFGGTNEDDSTDGGEDWEEDTDTGGNPPPPPPPPRREKVYVDGVAVSILNERVQYYGEDGRLTNQSIKDFSKESILKTYKTLDNFVATWTQAEKKKAIIDELKGQGIFLEALQKQIGKDLDPFDLVCHIAFDMPPLSRKERADNVKKRNYFGEYNEKAKVVLNNLLEKYATSGIENVESLKVLKLDPLRHLGTPREIFELFGEKKDYIEAVNKLKQEIYKSA